MVALYVVSSERAGKTTICAGVGKSLLDEGKRVGFLKPIIAEKRPVEDNDGDAAFMKQVLALPESEDSISPLIGEADKIKEAYGKVSQGKDVVIVEGTLGPTSDDNLSKASYEIAGVLNAKVIIVEGYSNQPSRFTGSYKEFGENLLGIVLNKVPRSQLKLVRDELSAQLGKAGVTVLGVLPEDRAQSSLTIGELADTIQGKILNNAEKSADLVENLMLGAMVVGSGLEYFGRKTKKAAVVRGDRPDMQLAALETPTRCLVISGSTEPPIQNVLFKAENKGTPIILADTDTNAIIKGIEDALDKTRFKQEKKLPKLAEIIREHLDFQAIYKGLGLAG